MQMRRLFSILIIALFWAGPLAALLPGSDEAQLPACCRRHGAHHCMMSGAGAEQATGSSHVLAAPAHCPRYPMAPPANAAAFALFASPAVAQSPGSRMLVAGLRSAAMQRTRTSADRGPPAVL
jgi:hypothetical protein